MPAYVASRNALACKLVTFYPNNAAKEMDTHMAHVLLFDETSGEIKAVIFLYLIIKGIAIIPYYICHKY
jgi:ornithine cyclodeaminase/alanine dehydrogenase-like protein (mu-crystallin family)